MAAALQWVEFLRQGPLQRERHSLLLPQQLHVPPPRAVGPLRDLAGLSLGVGHDDVPSQTQQRELGISLSEFFPLRAVGVGQRAGLTQEGHDVDVVGDGPGDSFRPRNAVPQRRMRLLHRLQRHRHAIEFVELPVISQDVMRQTAANDLERLGELLHAACEIDTEEPDLDRRDAAADAKQKAPATHLVEHADLVDEAQRVIKRQQIHHRPEPDLPRPLRDRGQEDTGRRGIAERRVVVLGEMVAVEPGAVIGLDQLQPLLEELADRHTAIIQMVEDPEAHFRRLPLSQGGIVVPLLCLL